MCVVVGCSQLYIDLHSEFTSVISVTVSKKIWLVRQRCANGDTDIRRKRSLALSMFPPGGGAKGGPGGALA